MYLIDLKGRRGSDTWVKRLAIIIAVAFIALGIPDYAPAAQTGEDACVQVNQNGFGIGRGQSLGMIVNDGYLYDCASSVFGLRIMQYDGSSWTDVNEPGFGNIFNQRGGARSVDGVLYVGTYNLLGGESWRYEGNNNWTQIASGGFGDPNNHSIRAEAEQGGTPYVGTGNNSTGCEIWRYDGGTSWTRVDGGVSPGNGGFGDPNNNQVWNMVNLGGQLYAAIENPTTGCEIWRYDGGTSWTRVDGGVSPGNGGFGKANNTNAELAAYRDELYAGVWNNTEGCEVALRRGHQLDPHRQRRLRRCQQHPVVPSHPAR